MNNINIENVFSVTLRDSGEVALIDGDTRQIWGIVKTGYAVPSRAFRPPAAARTLSAVTVATDLIDMWTEKPTTVATMKSGYEARSIDTPSKYKGFEDKYAIVGATGCPITPFSMAKRLSR